MKEFNFNIHETKENGVSKNINFSTTKPQEFIDVVLKETLSIVGDTEITGEINEPEPEPDKSYFHFDLALVDDNSYLNPRDKIFNELRDTCIPHDPFFVVPLLIIKPNNINNIYIGNIGSKYMSYLIQNHNELTVDIPKAMDWFSSNINMAMFKSLFNKGFYNKVREKYTQVCEKNPGHYVVYGYFYRKQDGTYKNQAFIQLQQLTK